ncbi:MAG: DinB family protein [Promethearchaeota archaeon]
MTTITDSLSRQFKSSLKMTRDAIEKVPDKNWNDGPKKWYFSLTAYHIVETLEFYSRNTPDDMEWGKRANFSWDDTSNIENDILPKISKKIVLEYIQDVEEKVSELMTKTTDQELVEKDGFHWFSCVLEKLEYVLRHTAHHCGELALALRVWDCKHIEWT